MLQFQGKNINSRFDLLCIKMQAFDFIKSLKFDKTSLERLSDLVYELTKELVLNQPHVTLYINSYTEEHRKGIEIYISIPQMTVDKVCAILKNDDDLAKKGISFDKEGKFLDIFEVRTEAKAGVHLHIVKWMK